MSADNWGVCPKCFKDNQKESEKLLDDMLKAKAANNLKKFEAAKTAYDEHVQLWNDLDNTLREDYECFISKEGRYYISYSAVCETCGFTKTLKIDEQLKF